MGCFDSLFLIVVRGFLGADLCFPGLVVPFRFAGVRFVCGV